MKTRSALVMEAPNIAAIVKARHHARVVCPTSTHPSTSTQSQLVSGTINDPSENGSNMTNLCNAPTTSGQTVGDEVRVPAEDKVHKNRSENPPKLLRGSWSPDDRRLFFQAVRLYGRNFNEITRFIRSRRHRTTADHQTVTSNNSTELNSNNPHSGNNLASSSSAPHSSNTSQSSTGVNTAFASNSDGSGRTREQVRFFYQQTWHKIRRYVKFPDEVPQHVREVYAIVNYSVIRTRIKKPLHHRLGEKLNELIHCGTTVIKHNGRRFLLRTPVCPALKQLNNIAAPTHEFQLPEDVWIELVPRTHADLWRVIEAEQNPRLRLRVDINRQLSDVIALTENKWQSAAERMRTLLDLPVVNEYTPSSVMLTLCPAQSIDGAIRIQEVARVRSGDLGLRAYLDRMNTKVPPHQLQSNVCKTEKQSTSQSSGLVASSSSSVLPQASSSSSCATKFNNNPSINSSSSIAELDLSDLGKKLSIGVTREMAREIKVVTIYLALGCPERIRFEYQFCCLKDKDGRKQQLNSFYSNLLLCPPLDPDGEGISNGLRRLLHLNASDYLLHRDWSSRHSTQDKTSLPETSSSTQQRTPSALLPKPIQPSTSSNNTPTTGTYLSQISNDSPVVLTSQQPTLTMYPPSNAVQVLVNGQPSVVQLNSSLAASHPIISSLLTTSSAVKPPVTLTQSPKLVLLPQTCGQKVQVPIVERQLDHERQLTTSITPTQTSYMPLLGKQATASSKSVSFNLTNVTIPTTVTTTTPTISTSSYSVVEDKKPSTCAPSSLKSLKAFNARRKKSTAAQVHKHLNENSASDKELQSKQLPASTIASSSFWPLHNTVTHSPAIQSSSYPVQTFQVPINHAEQANADVALNNIVFNPQSSQIFLPSTFSLTSPLINQTTLHDKLPHIYNVSGAFSSTSNQSPVKSFVTKSKGSSSTDVTIEDLLLTSTETNQSSSSLCSNDTLASLLNTICVRYTPIPSSSSSSNLDHQNISDETSSRPADNITTTVETPVLNLNTKVDECVSFKMEEDSQFRTTDSVCNYPPGSPSIGGDISFTDSMAAAVMDVHHMQLDHSDEERNTNAQPGSLNFMASNVAIQPDVYSLGTSYESVLGDKDIKVTQCNNMNQSDYKGISNVEVFLRMNTPQSSQNSPGLISSTPTTSSASLY
ncbi:unnamed protein product [Trichobilharzia szidati]|nr:unnamed protein product [Trichobilharzia szidati]